MAYVTLQERLRGEIAKNLKKDLGIENVNALPRLKKVIVNVGINKTKMDSKELHEYINETLKKITGQKPIQRKAKKAISNFKTREGLVVGTMVTLRGPRMLAFVDRLVSYVLPEVGTVDANKIFVLQIQFTISGNSDEGSKALLTAIGMPFIKPKKSAQSVA